jgi:glycosyltransferase involved in cell wall biosynthesis
LAPTQNGLLLLSVGRLDPQKGYETLLRATALALQKMPDLRLWIVGDTQLGGETYRARLLALADELSLGERVQFLGVRRDVPALLAHAYALVMASRWEGFGLVFLEAMAAARPIIATRVSAVPEVVEDGVTGLLVPPDDPAALAEAILHLASDPDLAQRLGQAGWVRLRTHFRVEEMVHQTIRVYKEVCSAH